MIDPGRPFSVPYADLIQSLEDSLRNGVEQPGRAGFVVQAAAASFPLPRPADAVTRVSGQMQSAFTVFRPGEHYRFANNRIVWIHPAQRPDEGSRLEVEFVYRDRPSGLTDYNAGSVAGTLVRAIAREAALLYGQMDEAYRRGFIDIATGVALDNVVALLGIARKPAQKATGQVTFFRKTAARSTVTVKAGTRVADQGGRAFATLADGSIPAEIPNEIQERSGATVQTFNRIAQLVGVWRSTEPNPTPANRFATQDTGAGKPFGDDERTITFADGVRPDGGLLIHYQPKSVAVPVEALAAGPDGNVNAGTIVVMPTPPKGVDGVVNEAPLGGGQPAEADDPLRDRAKNALELAGNATLNAIKFAVLKTDGVEEVEVRDRSIDPTIPPGEVRVRYFGGDGSAARQQSIRKAVADAVEQTRAAGILARVEAIATVPVAGSFLVIPKAEVSDATLPAVRADMQSFRGQAVAGIQALGIGEPLSLRRLSALVYGTAGLADVAEAQLRYQKEGADTPAPDPLIVGSDELLRPNAAALTVTLLGGLGVAGGTGTNQILVQVIGLEELTDAGGVAQSRPLNQPAAFRSLSMDVNVVLEARLKNKPTDPPEQIASFTRTAQFQDTATCVLSIQRSDIPLTDTRLADYMLNGDNPGEEPAQASLGAAAYPGLRRAANAPVNLVF